jgi:hypothetical protein
MGSVKKHAQVDCIEKWGYTLRRPREFIYNSTSQFVHGEVVFREVFGTKGPEECVIWDSESETPCLVA